MLTDGIRSQATFAHRSCIVVVASVILALTPLQPGLARTNCIRSAAGLTVRLNDSSGHYEIASSRPRWTFAGDLGAPARDAGVRRGTDSIGAYHEIHFSCPSKTAATGSIRVYDKTAVALFTLTCDQPAEKWPAVFPRFTSFPARLHHYSFGERAFAPPHFDLQTNGTPWLLFDDHANAALISPANQFFMATLTGDGVHEIASCLKPDVQGLPAHFSYSTLMAFEPGIRAVWQTWGRALMAFHGKTRPSNDADLGLRCLGYWTDNGASYYYNYNTALGYEGTLQELVGWYRDVGNPPLRYLQLDSWWYPKTLTGPDGKPGQIVNRRLPDQKWNHFGGLLTLKADPDVLPDGLAGLHRKIGSGLITHSRWIDPESPYHQQYRISGLAAVDPKFWDDTMESLTEAGVFCYEQDWLSTIYEHSPALHTTPGLGDAFADNMARAARQQGMSLQYCMALPCCFLQGSRYGNLTTIRTSGDRFRPRYWDSFIYVSQLARAVGVWPWTDVFMSPETNNLLISVLSAGMVGVGDVIGQEYKENLFLVARTDAVLVKPDESLMPLDSVYVAQANGRKAPMVAWTYSDHGRLRTAYVFAYNREQADANASFVPADLGLRGKVCILDVRSGTAVFQSASKRVRLSFEPGGTAYSMITPVGRSRIAFFGDEGKYVSNAHQRIAALNDVPGKLTVTTTFASGEGSVRLFGYADQAPRVTAQSGSVGNVDFDARTHRFTVEVSPASEAGRSRENRVRQSVVVFERK